MPGHVERRATQDPGTVWEVIKQHFAEDADRDIHVNYHLVLSK